MSSLDETLEQYWNNLKLDGRLGLLLEYTPIIGPLFTSGTALKALLNGFKTKQIDDQTSPPLSSSSSSSGTIAALDERTSKIIRIKGLSSICSGLVDICLLCFCVVIMSFAGDYLVKLTNNILIYRSVILMIILNCIAVSIGAKLVSVQMIEFSTSQLEQVHTVSSSVVKSASITASAIEKIVITTNHRTGLAIGAFDSFINRLIHIFTIVLAFPNDVKHRLIRIVKYELRRILRIFRFFRRLLRLTKVKNV